MFTKEQNKKIKDVAKEAYEGGQPIADKAFEKGLVAVLPNENELFLDIDTDEDYKIFLFHRTLLGERFFAYPEYECIPSSSGLPHRHIIVTLPFKVTQDQRIALQAALGSDRKRELLSICESIDAECENHETPVTLFESKDSPFAKNRKVATTWIPPFPEDLV